jgi:hypothetical protein
LASEGITTQVTGEELAHAQPLNFAPRVGFAFQATNRFVVRGGYGISYGGVEANVNQDLITTNFPVADTVSLTTTNPEQALSSDGSIGSLETNYLNISLNPATVTASGIALVSMDQDWKTTYTESMNFMMEYQLDRDMSLTIGYVGSVGRHIVTTVDANAPKELLIPGTATTSFLPYPKTATTGDNVTSTDGSSRYNSLQVTLEKHISHGFDFLANYTYQKTLTTAHDPLENDIGGYLAPYLLGLDSVKADFNVPQVLHFSGTWRIPFGASLHGFTKAAAYGWSFNGIGTAEEGQPITVGCPRATTVTGFTCHALLAPGVNPYANSTVSHFLNAAAFINPGPVTVNGQVDFTPLGSQGTQVNGPAFRRIDASLFKRFDITKRVYTEFRFEVFNVTNTANFSAPSNLDFTNSQFGQITSTRDSPNDPREVQLAGKIYF